jgi:hypothetical protein
MVTIAKVLRNALNYACFPLYHCHIFVMEASQPANVSMLHGLRLTDGFIDERFANAGILLLF